MFASSLAKPAHKSLLLAALVNLSIALEDRQAIWRGRIAQVISRMKALLRPYIHAAAPVHTSRLIIKIKA